MTKRCIVLAAAFMAAFTISAETVKTASQPWVTNRIEQAVAPLAAELTGKAAATTTEVTYGDWVCDPGVMDGYSFGIRAAKTSSGSFIGWFATRDGMAITDIISFDANATRLEWQAETLHRSIDVVATRTVTTNSLGIVRSNVSLLIREVTAANGQRQFRLIRRADD